MAHRMHKISSVFNVLQRNTDPVSTSDAMVPSGASSKLGAIYPRDDLKLLSWFSHPDKDMKQMYKSNILNTPISNGLTLIIGAVVN